MPCGNKASRGASALALGLLLATSAAAPAAATITGVCPDGSIFIVKREADIPCSAAKRVEPHQVPPIKPEFLPRPYAWEVFQEQQDPNNPYNLVDKARQVRSGERGPEEADGAQGDAEAQRPPAPTVSSAPKPEPAPAVSTPPPPRAELSLSAEERRDLALIVELTQQRVPAAFEQPSAGAPGLIVRLAHSRAFEARLHAFRAARGEAPTGPVLLFSAEARAPSAFYANFTFAQGHSAFHPEPEDPLHFGLLEGGLGPLAAGQKVLGYVVLPTSVDVAQPMDVYWNDRRLAATLRP